MVPTKNLNKIQKNEQIVKKKKLSEIQQFKDPDPNKSKGIRNTAPCHSPPVMEKKVVNLHQNLLNPCH